MRKPIISALSGLLALGCLTQAQPVLANPLAAPNLVVPHLEDADPAEAMRLELRLSQRRVTLYRGKTKVKEYPVAVGRAGWETPTGVFRVKRKVKDPVWVHPFEKGVRIPGGDPENPLGRHWIGFWTDGKNSIGFHGTPNLKSVGTAASHGCVRMYPKDIEELFQKVSLGTLVIVLP